MIELRTDGSVQIHNEVKSKTNELKNSTMQFKCLFKLVVVQQSLFIYIYLNAFIKTKSVATQL